MAGKQDKAAAKEAAKARRAASRERRKQIFEAFKMQRREDKALIPLMLGAVLGVTAIAVVLGLVFNAVWMFVPLGVAIGALLAAYERGLQVLAVRATRRSLDPSYSQPAARQSDRLGCVWLKGEPYLP